MEASTEIAGTCEVEAPSAIVNQELGNLPEGVSITPGRITVTFNTTQQALEKLLALNHERAG